MSEAYDILLRAAGIMEQVGKANGKFHDHFSGSMCLQGVVQHVMGISAEDMDIEPPFNSMEDKKKYRDAMAAISNVIDDSEIVDRTPPNKSDLWAVATRVAYYNNQDHVSTSMAVEKLRRAADLVAA
jgi:hypothetical protein